MKVRYYRVVSWCVVMLLLVSLFAGGVLAQPADGSAEASATSDEAAGSSAEGGESGTSETGEEIKTAVLRVNVSQKGDDGLPIKNARVIVTYDEETEFERKTDDAGVAELPGLPYGQADVDVTSSGMQSAGSEITVDEPEESLDFSLEPRLLAQ